jgi:acyl-CoA reductase-like NAD-dependent aldehyde dehydrogenase
VTGPGAEIGTAVIDQSDVVCFTGSTPTGKTVAAQAAGKLVHASLELGGKNPMIVLDDVDPAKAAGAAVYACFSSMGQLCVSDERVFVQRAVAEPFIAEFVKRTKALKQGAALDYSLDVGALTLPSQVERVQEHVDDAVKKGATVLAGGRIRDDLGPNFYEPTVLTGVTPEMTCYANETFGPVVWIQVVDTEDEAIAAANDSTYGLNASVFSGSAPRAFSVAERLDCGSVNINEGYRATFSSADAPMGGMKESGLGRRNGPEGLARFIESRTIARATGLLTLPRTGRQFEKLGGPMTLLLKVLKTVRRR